MGRKANTVQIREVVQIVQQNDDNIRMADIARTTGLHPETVSRALARAQQETGIMLQEDDKGFLGIFKGRR